LVLATSLYLDATLRVGGSEEKEEVFIRLVYRHLPPLLHRAHIILLLHTTRKRRVIYNDIGKSKGSDYPSARRDLT